MSEQDPQPLPDQDPTDWDDFLFKPAPDSPISLPPRSQRPKRTPQYTQYMRPRIQVCFKSLTYRERCHMISRLFDVLWVLELKTEDFYEVFEDFYYDIDQEDFEPIMARVDEEIENMELYFLEEYEREYKDLLVVSNMEREFWEGEEAKKPKQKKPRKRKKIDKITIINQQLQKLFQEREEFFSTINVSFGCKEDKDDLLFKIDHRIIKDPGQSYALRERKSEFKQQAEEINAVDHEEARIFNTKFRIKYSELMKQKKGEIGEGDLKKPSPTPVNNTVVLSEKAIREKVERNLALQWIRKKTSSCFIEEKPKIADREKEKNQEVNSKTETVDSVRLTDLGVRTTVRERKRKQGKKIPKVTKTIVKKDSNSKGRKNNSKNAKKSIETPSQLKATTIPSNNIIVESVVRKSNSKSREKIKEIVNGENVKFNLRSKSRSKEAKNLKLSSGKEINKEKQAEDIEIFGNSAVQIIESSSTEMKNDQNDEEEKSKENMALFKGKSREKETVFLDDDVNNAEYDGKELESDEVLPEIGTNNGFKEKFIAPPLSEEDCFKPDSKDSKGKRGRKKGSKNKKKPKRKAFGSISDEEEDDDDWREGGKKLRNRSTRMGTREREREIQQNNQINNKNTSQNKQNTTQNTQNKPNSQNNKANNSQNKPNYQKTTNKKGKNSKKPVIREVINLDEEEEGERERTSNILWSFDEFSLNTSYY